MTTSQLFVENLNGCALHTRIGDFGDCWTDELCWHGSQLEGKFQAYCDDRIADIERVLATLHDLESLEDVNELASALRTALS